MKKVSLTAVVLALATASAWAHEGHEHGGHHLNNLPASCEAYFKRADACFAKAGESPSSFQAFAARCHAETARGNVRLRG